MWTRLKKIQEKHFILFDTFFSFFIILILFIFLKIYDSENKLVDLVYSNKDIKNFLLTMAQIYGTILGFVMAVAAMIFSLDHSKKIEFIKKGKHYPSVLLIFTNATRYLLLALIVNICLFFINFTNASFKYFFFYSIMWLFMINIIKIKRCIWILIKLFKLSL